MSIFTVSCIAYIRGFGEPDYCQHLFRIVTAYDKNDAQEIFLDYVEHRIHRDVYLIDFDVQ